MTTPRYTVRRIGWFQPPFGDPYTRRLPTAEPVESFGTFDAADEHRHILESAARESENPFRFGGASVFFQSSLDGPRLHDWLMDAGIDPPASELRHADWRDWWNAFAHMWRGDQLAHAWAAFDKVRFFDVSEAAPGAAHLLLAIGWEPESTVTLSAAPEGGRVVAAYRTLARAQTELTTRNRAVAIGRNYRGAQYFRYDRRAGYDSTERTVWIAQGTFFEIVAVPSDVPPMAGLGYLVQRRTVLAPQRYPAWRRRSEPDARVPVALFADRATAVGCRDRLLSEARLGINPFAFAEPHTGAATDDGREVLGRLKPPLPVPDSDRRTDWLEWFDLCQDEMSDEQRTAAWDACDQPLFEVIRVEVGDD
jgi:hypothetical protein